MTIEQSHERNKQTIRAASIGSGLGILGLEGAGHLYFNNKTTLPKALTRAGLASAATLGALMPIEFRLHRAAKATKDKMRVKEASEIMEQRKTLTTMYAATDFKDFVKTAASVMGPSAFVVDKDIAYNAFELYSLLPEKTAAEIVSQLYEHVRPGMNKVAMEMVAANILANEKHASVISGVKTVGKNLGSFAGKAFEPTLTGAGIYAGTKDRMASDKPLHQQGKSNKVVR